MLVTAEDFIRAFTTRCMAFVYGPHPLARPATGEDGDG